MVLFSQLLWYFVTLYLQREGDELLLGYLSLHQTCESLNLKWTPNQLINSEQNSTGDKLHTHTEETNHNSPSIPTATPVENGFVLTSYCLPQYFVFSLIITVVVNVLLITQISQYSTWIDIDLLFLSMSFQMSTNLLYLTVLFCDLLFSYTTQIKESIALVYHY